VKFFPSCTPYALQWFVPFVLFLVDSGQRKFLEARVRTARHASTKPSLLIYLLIWIFQILRDNVRTYRESQVRFEESNFAIPYVKIQTFRDRSFTWFLNHFLAKFLEIIRTGFFSKINKNHFLSLVLTRVVAMATIDTLTKMWE